MTTLEYMCYQIALFFAVIGRFFLATLLAVSGHLIVGYIGLI
jgi:hypothetical protein